LATIYGAPHDRFVKFHYKCVINLFVTNINDKNRTITFSFRNIKWPTATQISLFLLPVVVVQTLGIKMKLINNRQELVAEDWNTLVPIQSALMSPS